MIHVAILRKSKIKDKDNLLKDILEGKKTIESRWYKNKIAPWDKIRTGEIIYLKESGCPITAKAIVSKVLQYDNLDQNTIEEIIRKYGKQIAPNTSLEEFLKWGNELKGKNYCILIFLEKVENIRPFEFDKTGFGNACAWISTQSLNKVE